MRKLISARPTGNSILNPKRRFNASLSEVMGEYSSLLVQHGAMQSQLSEAKKQIQALQVEISLLPPPVATLT
jgi:chromosome segregation ATPase